MSTAISTTAATSPPSQRWTHFHAALQLAIQRASHKWTYSDFAECFSLWCEEQPDGSGAVFNAVSGHMESLITQNCDGILDNYAVRSNVDILHVVVTEARARKQRGEIGKDVWREDVQPRAAVRARTMPLLVNVRARMQKSLEELEDENLRLQEEARRNSNERKEVDEKVVEMLDILDEVYEKWCGVKLEDVEMWTVQTAEASKTL